MNDRGPRAAVEKFDANENVGDGQLQPGKLDALARQTVWPRINPAPFHEGVRQFLYVGISQILNVVRQLQHHRQTHARKDWRAPQHAELSGRGLFDLEIGGARLVGRGDRNGKQQTSREPGEACTEPGHSGASLDGAGTGTFVFGGGTGA